LLGNQLLCIGDLEVGETTVMVVVAHGSAEGGKNEPGAGEG
jgi:hypothetical protein